MKNSANKLTFLTLLVAIIFGCTQGNTSQRNDDQNPEASLSFYGDRIDMKDAIPVQTLLDELGDSDSLNTKVEATILETCEMKGCWMTVKLDEGTSMRVTFKDYGFFVPKEGMQGKKTYFEGKAEKTVMDVETLRHYAEDEGKSEEEIAAITEPRTELTFVASGVIIVDAE